MSSLNEYYCLTKPGIIRGNLLTAAAGFFLASNGNLNWIKLTLTLIGLALIIASGCVFNNILDRDMDKKMERTKNRALPNGRISVSSALIYGSSLIVLGSIALLQTQGIALVLALLGWFFYVVVYGIGKRLTYFGTLIGSISGAMPPLVGYSAAAGRLDLAALILFLILVTWQMPHFYSIAVFRLEEYKLAGVPVLPAVKGIDFTKKQILFYVQAFLFASLALSVFGYTGYFYFIVVASIGILWIWLTFKGGATNNNVRWAKGMFKYSISALSLICVLIYFNEFLP